MFYDNPEFLYANLLVKFKSKFFDFITQSLKQNIILDAFCKDDEMNALFGAHYKIFLEAFLSYCNITQNESQILLVNLKPEAWNSVENFDIENHQKEILEFFIERTVESFDNLILILKDESKAKSLEYELVDSFYSLNVLTFFIGKYPLLIPYIISNVVKKRDILFIDFLMNISTNYYNLGRRFFFSLISNNYFFEKESNTNVHIKNSGNLWLQYFKNILLEKLKNISKDQTMFLKNDENVIQWKLCLELLNSLNFSFFELENHEKHEFSQELYHFLWEIIESRENMNDFFFLEKSFTFDILAQLQTEIIHEEFKAFTGLNFVKKKHNQYLKHYLNILLQKIDKNQISAKTFIKIETEKKPRNYFQENPETQLKTLQSILHKIPSNFSRKIIDANSEILKITLNTRVNRASINKLHLHYVDNFIDLENKWLTNEKGNTYKFSKLFSFFDNLSKNQSKEFSTSSKDFFKLLHTFFENFPPYLKNIDEDLILDLDSYNRSPSTQRNNDLYLTLMDLSVELLVGEDMQKDCSKESQKNQNNLEEIKEIEKKQEDLFHFEEEEKVALSHSEHHPIDQIINDFLQIF